MADRLTRRQREVLGAFAELSITRGHSPTHRELAAHIGIKSTNGVREHLLALVRKGLIEHRPMTARGHQLPIRLPLTMEGEEPPPEPPHQERYHATIDVTRTEDGGMVLVIQRTPQQLELPGGPDAG